MAGFGHGPFGVGAFGEADWGTEVFAEGIPDIYHQLDQEQGNNRLSQFLTAIAPVFNEQKRFIRRYDHLRDPLKAPSDGVAVLVVNIDQSYDNGDGTSLVFLSEAAVGDVYEYIRVGDVLLDNLGVSFTVTAIKSAELPADLDSNIGVDGFFDPATGVLSAKHIVVQNVSSKASTGLNIGLIPNPSGHLFSEGPETTSPTNDGSHAGPYSFTVAHVPMATGTVTVNWVESAVGRQGRFFRDGTYGGDIGTGSSIDFATGTIVLATKLDPSTGLPAIISANSITVIYVQISNTVTNDASVFSQSDLAFLAADYGLALDRNDSEKLQRSITYNAFSLWDIKGTELSYEILGKFAGFTVTAEALNRISGANLAVVPADTIITDNVGNKYTDVEPAIPLFDQIPADVISLDQYCFEPTFPGFPTISGTDGTIASESVWVKELISHDIASVWGYDDSHIWAVEQFRSEVYFSTGNGAWITLSNLPTQGFFWNVNIWSPDGVNVFISSVNDQTLLYKSTDGGATWSTIPTFVLAGQTLNVFYWVGGTSLGNMYAIAQNSLGTKTYLLNSTNGGATWTSLYQQDVSGVVGTLQTAWVNSSTDVWFGDDRGTIYHWNGASVTSTLVDIHFEFIGIPWGTSSTNMYFVGTYRTSTIPPVWHWNGSTFTALPIPGQDVDSGDTVIFGHGPDDIWTVDGVNFFPVAYQSIDGVTFSEQVGGLFPSDGFQAVWVGSSKVYVAGSALIARKATPVFGEMTFTALGTPFSASDVGRFLRITGASNPTNNGSFPITAYIGPSEVGFYDPSGVSESFTGTWEIPGQPIQDIDVTAVSQIATSGEGQVYQVSATTSQPDMTLDVNGVFTDHAGIDYAIMNLSYGTAGAFSFQVTALNAPALGTGTIKWTALVVSGVVSAITTIGVQYSGHTGIRYRLTVTTPVQPFSGYAVGNLRWIDESGKAFWIESITSVGGTSYIEVVADRLPQTGPGHIIYDCPVIYSCGFCRSNKILLTIEPGTDGFAAFSQNGSSIATALERLLSRIVSVTPAHVRTIILYRIELTAYLGNYPTTIGLSASVETDISGGEDLSAFETERFDRIPADLMTLDSRLLTATVEPTLI